MNNGRTYYADDETIAHIAKLEAELAEAVRLLETVRLVGRMDDWNKCAGLIDAFLARQEAKQ